MKTVFLNGEFVSADAAKVSVSDRGFLYGDGLFETLRVYGGKPFVWERHMARLIHGAQILKIDLPYFADELAQFARELITRNQLSDAVIRIQLSRGSGARGYSTRGADYPVIVMTMHPLLAPLNRPIRLVTSVIRVPAIEPLAVLKTCNKLPQVLARREAEEKGADEALILNHHGEVAESTSSNLFWIEKGTVCTPPVNSGILPGITRSVVLELCAELKILNLEKSSGPAVLWRAEGVFLTSSVQEIIEAGELDGKPFSRSPLIGKLLEAYRARTAGNAVSRSTE